MGSSYLSMAEVSVLSKISYERLVGASGALEKGKSVLIGFSLYYPLAATDKPISFCAKICTLKYSPYSRFQGDSFISACSNLHVVSVGSTNTQFMGK